MNLNLPFNDRRLLSAITTIVGLTVMPGLALACVPHFMAINKFGPATVAPGQTVTYTIEINNPGNIASENVLIRDPIPSNVLYLQSLNSPLCRQVSAGLIECQPPNVPGCRSRSGDRLCIKAVLPRNSYTFTLTFLVPSNTLCGSLITNQAHVYGYDPAVAQAGGIGHLLLSSSTLVQTTVVCNASSSSVATSASSSSLSSSVASSVASSSLSSSSLASSASSSVASSASMASSSVASSVSSSSVASSSVPASSSSLSSSSLASSVSSASSSVASSASSSSFIPQCRDGIDNDFDGAADYPYDFSCSGPDDNDETFPKAQCQDGIDNDGDGKVDYPQDPGCYSYQDNDEFDQVTTAVEQCRDGLDNDGDGKIDIGDPGCHTDNNVNNVASYNPYRNSELDAAAQPTVVADAQPILVYVNTPVNVLNNNNVSANANGNANANSNPVVGATANPVVLSQLFAQAYATQYVAMLPQTGIPSFTATVAGTQGILNPIANSSPLGALWTMISVAGTGIGATIGRKLFF